MRTIRQNISLAWMLIKMGWQSQISYMGITALFSYIAQIIQFASLFGVVWLMMRSFSDLSGFNMWEVFILFSLELFSYALANSFLQPLRKMKELLFNGELDFYLVRPIHPMFYIMAKGFAPGYTAHMVLSTIIIIISSIQLNCITSVSFWILIILTIVISVGIQFGIRCIPALLSFWLGNINNLQWIVGSFREMVRYPIKIYPAFIQVILTIIIPYAFVNYYPSLLIFDKIVWWQGILLFVCGIFVSAIYVYIPIAMFKRGLKKYESGNG